MKKQEAFDLIQRLKQEVRPEAFRAVWVKLQPWDFDFKGLVLDGVPVVDSRRMVELRTTKPSQTLGWEKAKARTADDSDVGSRKSVKAEAQELASKLSTERPSSEDSPQQGSDASKSTPKRAEDKKNRKSEESEKAPEKPK